MMTLYWAPQSRAVTALWLMEEAGRPYERVLVDIRNGKQDTADYRAVNPMGKVPALKDGDVTLAETPAICAYVAERVPEAKLSPPPGEPARARFLYWLFFYSGCMEPAVTQLVAKVDIPSSTAGWGDAARVFDVLDDALKNAPGPWLLGENFSAADVMIGSGLNFFTRGFKVVPPRPSFDAYIDRCMARPAFQRAMAIQPSA